MIENNSGEGKGCIVPNEVKNKFNFGAFLYAPLWAAFNNAKPLAKMLFPPLTLLLLSGLLKLPPIIIGISNIILIIVWIIAGFKGNEWAWQYKKWDSIEHFHKIQRYWAIFTLIPLVFIIILFGVLMALIIK